MKKTLKVVFITFLAVLVLILIFSKGDISKFIFIGKYGFGKVSYIIYRPLAEMGVTRFQKIIGINYLLGDYGYKQDYDQAEKWLKKAAENGNRLAQYNLAIMYEEGLGVKQDYKEAFRWYGESAKNGFPPALNNLASMYRKGKGIPRDYQKAFSLYYKAAEKGDDFAQYNLGYMYANGQGIQRNNTEAVKWFTKAANQEHLLAQFCLGFMYDTGWGIEQNRNEAQKWYNQAVKKEGSDFLNKLEVSIPVTIIQKDCYGWYLKKSRKENPVALRNIGFLVLYHGKLNFENDEDAITDAADHGVSLAQLIMGFRYSWLKNIPNDYPEALKWFKKAADQGDPTAQFMLGEMYAQGLGVSKNNSEAYKWCYLSLSNGFSSAKTRVDDLTKRMTPAQIEEAKKRSAEFKPLSDIG
jgi:TPR repeat protein